MNNRENFWSQVDWLTIAIYGALVFMGLMNIYASAYSDDASQNLLGYTVSRSQLFWALGSAVVVVAILVVDYRFYDSAAGYLVYGVVIVMLLAVLVFGHKVGGARSWFDLGFMRLQPSEFAKFATAWAMAKFIGDKGRIEGWKNKLYAGLFAIVPAALIILQPDAGTMLVFGAFVIVLYREGLSPLYLVIAVAAMVLFILTLLIENNLWLILGIVALATLAVFTGPRVLRRIAIIAGVALLMIGYIFSVDVVLNQVLKPHQQKRIEVLVNPNTDPMGAGYNVTQSKIAIGSGGFSGKGFLQGTQTKLDFVPEQSTDFIFCTLGEEHGYLGSVVVIGLFLVFMLRLVAMAERQKTAFARVYGYSVASIFFFHLAINIGMTIGLFPVVGIPLPFFSYGGSSLLAFTVLLFIFIKVDAHRGQVLQR